MVRQRESEKNGVEEICFGGDCGDVADGRLGAGWRRRNGGDRNPRTAKKDDERRNMPKNPYEVQKDLRLYGSVQVPLQRLLWLCA